MRDKQKVGDTVVSLKDIASHCGVSVATVSKALNGHTDIGVPTRERICRIAAEMGYLPNAAARALKTHRTYNLGVLFVDERQSGLSHDYFSAVLDSFKVEAEAHGYDITFINHNIGGRPTTYLEHCRYRGVDGVVVACVDFTDPQVMELASSALPVVTIDHVFAGCAAVLSDNTAGMDELVRYVHGKGHRRIAFIHGERTAVTESRLESFYNTCAQLQITVPEAYVREGVYHDPERCAQMTSDLLALDCPPTCILLPDDFSAVGGLGAIAEAGLSVPEDISVAGYDGVTLSQVMKPQLTTYRQDTFALGREAARRLVALIEQPGAAQVDCAIVRGELLPGGTVRPI